jgi:hypothetical protein
MAAYLRWPVTSRGKIRSRAPAILFALGFLAAVAAAVYFRYLRIEVIIAYATLSVITFVAYAIDKVSAKRGGQKTRCRTIQDRAMQYSRNDLVRSSYAMIRRL